MEDHYHNVIIPHLQNEGFKLQRKQRLEALILKRKHNVSYIAKVYNGSSFWLNCRLLTSKDIQNYITQNVPILRTKMYFYLGLSVSRILIEHQSGGAIVVKAFAQLLEEWEYHFASSAMQSVRFVLAKNSISMYPQTSHYSATDGDADVSSSRGNIHKFNGTIVYEHLLTPAVPFDLDYVEVTCSLSEVLMSLYDNFMQAECYNNNSVYELIIKLDLKLKHHFINLIAKELTDTTLTSIKLDIEGFRGRIQGTN